MGLQEAPHGNIAKILQTALAKTHALLGKSVMQSVQLYVFGPVASESLIEGGFGGLVGRKKGAVAIGINYRAISMVFVSFHLSETAHAHNVEERNVECRHISTLSSPRTGSLSPVLPGYLDGLGISTTGWRGSGHTLPGSSYRNIIHHKMLISKHQLLHEAEQGEIFDGYSEGSLRFKPAYKYNIGSSDYDRSHKAREPSWTDRILFKIEDANAIRLTLRCYESVDDTECSDHKPIKKLVYA